MSTKKRLLRISLIVTLVVLFAGYFTFSTLLFPPLEDDFEHDVAALIPRDVDFFAAKAGLEDDFSRFPRLAVLDRLEGHEAWDLFTRSAEYQDLRRRLRIDETLAELETSLARLPLGLEPQDIFGGRDLALAGYFREGGLEHADWALYGRVQWAGKLAASALAYPKLVGLESQGISVQHEEGRSRLSGPGLARPIWVSRLRDVVVVSTSEEMVSGALELAQRGGERSLLQSAAYFDHIQNAPTRRTTEDEIELALDIDDLSAAAALGPWPDVQSQDLATALAGRLFQLGACKDVVGVLGLEEGLRVDLRGALTTERMSALQQRVYRERGFERRDILQVASYVPADAALFAYVHAPLADMIRAVLDSAEPALRSNLEDAFRSLEVFEGLEQVIGELDESLRDRAALVVRRDDYPREMGIDPETGEETYVGPPNDGTPVFAVALLLWVSDRPRIESLRDLIGNHGSVFGLQGREPGQGGYWKNKKGGFEIREFWSPFVPGTGVIATSNVGEVMVVANNLEMPTHLLRTNAQGGNQFPRLSERPDFQALVDSSLHDANVLVWASPREASSTLAKQAQRWAEDNAQASVDWHAMRAEEERAAIPRLFPGKARGQLSADEQRQLDAVVDPVLREMASRHRSEQVPVLVARKTRQITYVESIAGALAMLKLDPKEFELSVRVLTPLD